ncbi:hypothetical protein RFI_08208 [Reticulomyxa filosa]|uniref:Uncharacterized protein n=1 Tax=Reticulomyxa filosa TaxID=46433 RepID=X6NUJ1_RETFI|nr:hypothetical protein RFI_08208 [Reticulomyxa filosa]|eukprot:ETO28917.1 hypothetical protein RFI_08208 [Reticulomyxa filosa]
MLCQPKQQSADERTETKPMTDGHCGQCQNRHVSTCTWSDGIEPDSKRDGCMNSERKEEYIRNGGSHRIGSRSSSRSDSYSAGNGNARVVEECKSLESTSVQHSNISNIDDPNCHDCPPMCVKMIDYSNVHSLKTFLPLMKEQNAKKLDDENQERIWLDDQVDNEQEPDHGVLLGLECLCMLLAELKNTGTIKHRTDEEWLEIVRSIPCYQKALKPLVDALKNIENKSKTHA